MAEPESEPRTCPKNSPASAEASPGETGLGIAGAGGRSREERLNRWNKDGATEEEPQHWAMREKLGLGRFAKRPHSGTK